MKVHKLVVTVLAIAAVLALSGCGDSGSMSDGSRKDRPEGVKVDENGDK